MEALRSHNMRKTAVRRVMSFYTTQNKFKIKHNMYCAGRSNCTIAVDRKTCSLRRKIAGKYADHNMRLKMLLKEERNMHSSQIKFSEKTACVRGRGYGSIGPPHYDSKKGSSVELPVARQLQKATLLYRPDSALVALVTLSVPRSPLTQKLIIILLSLNQPFERKGIYL